MRQTRGSSSATRSYYGDNLALLGNWKKVKSEEYMVTFVNKLATFLFFTLELLKGAAFHQNIPYILAMHGLHKYYRYPLHQKFNHLLHHQL